ncbi:MAG: hypothetical protein KKD74_01010 [Bacteroidetes bacterium]|nr:hypothetical protein [Bacteroidota bacterium]
MKRFSRSVIGLVMMVIIAYSCNSGSGNKMIGTWKAADVKIDFDEQMSSPEMLKQVAEREKQTYLNFVNDTVLNIVTGENTYKAFWVMDEKTGLINYRFDDAGVSMNELGHYVDKTIVASSSTPLGTITITYKKEK